LLHNHGIFHKNANDFVTLEKFFNISSFHIKTTKNAKSTKQKAQSSFKWRRWKKIWSVVIKLSNYPIDKQLRTAHYILWQCIRATKTKHVLVKVALYKNWYFFIKIFFNQFLFYKCGHRNVLSKRQVWMSKFHIINFKKKKNSWTQGLGFFFNKKLLLLMIQFYIPWEGEGGYDENLK
jgi:hypothetical protein